MSAGDQEISDEPGREQAFLLRPCGHESAVV